MELESGNQIINCEKKVSDGKNIITFTRYTIDMCQTLKNIINDCPILDDAIELGYEVGTLKLVNKYCQYNFHRHVRNKYRTSEIRDKEVLTLLEKSDFENLLDNYQLTAWEINFFQELKMTDIFALIKCADFLNNELLINACSKYIASVIKELKTPEEIKKMFRIPTPDREIILETIY